VTGSLAPLAPSGPVRVLLAGGYPPMQEYIQYLLEDAGCEVIAAPDVQSALVADQGPGVDLVLIDATTPAAQAVRAVHLGQAMTVPPPAVMALVDNRVSGSRLLGLENGIVDFVTIPFEPAEIKARVRAAARAKRQRDVLLVQAVTDALTGLANRRYLDLRGTALIALARRYGRRLSCVMLDLDHFKAINDEFGHAAGDAVLRQVATVLKEVSRVSDIVGRYAGDEFVILLPEADEAGAHAAAEKVHHALSDLEVLLPSRGSRAVQVRASIGVAQWEPNMTSPATLFAAADDALYRAKASGRNRVVVSRSAPAA
jgi:two-component system, cell cycle response regulator